MRDEPAAARRAILAALIAATTLGLHPGLSDAAPAKPKPKLRDGLFKKAPAPGRQFTAPPVARYVTEDGDLFTLDRTGTVPLLRFDDSPEVWALSQQPAPRGDVIYKDEMGRAVLRATRVGGITLFTEAQPNGQAVSFAGGGIPLRIQQVSPQALGERLLHAAFRSNRATRHPIAFQADGSPSSAGLMVDAATVASIAFLEVAERPDARLLLAGISKVQLVEGAKPAALVKEGTLWITVNPYQGVAGRPSSERIVKALTKGR